MDARAEILTTLLDSGISVQAVYLFGSRARGDANSQSDWDLAVLAGQTLDPVHRWEVQERLASALHANVDLVDLRAASTVLRFKVVEEGLLVDDRDPRARAEFEMYTLSDYQRLQLERRLILEDAAKPGWLGG